MPGAQHADLEVNGKKGWSVTWATGTVNAWRSGIRLPLTVVIVKNPSFRNPLILVTSLMPSTVEEEFNVYRTYLLRWKIEQISQTIKEWGLESFRFVIHNLLAWILQTMRYLVKWKRVLASFLRQKRKIPTLLVGGLKIVYQYYLQKTVTLRELFSSHLRDNYALSN